MSKIQIRWLLVFWIVGLKLLEAGFMALGITLPIRMDTWDGYFQGAVGLVCSGAVLQVIYRNAKQQKMKVITVISGLGLFAHWFILIGAFLNLLLF